METVEEGCAVGHVSSCPVPMPCQRVLWVVGEGMVQASPEQLAVSRGRITALPPLWLTPLCGGGGSCGNLCLLIGLLPREARRVYSGGC